ncbi:hypothetical protein IVB38_14300 [Bradyrhizobium sp. 38]|uniref:hypothetical protein n=1 Tax=unclassified Bradyrhizobium TaxID=2631580 RepID=UPI001FF72B15|nr:MULTISPECIES: hypothetical protein [unclassified Bradyrhizobium]MCK1337167.1 hypothetical protein [Bradyrhizobium sp. 38]MCK1778267.1 hypothetical protein [Bradyrhizobium sp. 132]
MEYRVDNRVVLSTDREHKNLYSWSIKEFDPRGKQIGGDHIPWAWGLSFEAIELIPTCNLRISTENGEAETSKAEISEYIYGKLRPSVEARQSGFYSMFGTQRGIPEFGLFVYQATDGQDRCRLWGTIRYESEWDFERQTQEDSVQIYVHLSAEKFDHLMGFVKFPRPTSAELRLKGVSGFYSEWSPSIRTDNIKILANAKDQGLEDPQGLSFDPPVLGHVQEFDLRFGQQYPLIVKERS